MSEAALRAALVETYRRMVELGLNHATAGNVGARLGDGMLVSPSGLPAELMTTADVAWLDRVGDRHGRFHGPRAPSSEWRFHADILAARPEIGAVVHCHSLYATTLACRHLAIPAFHYMVAVAGAADIRCARYATFGTQALSDHAVAALDGRKACLLANHGMIAIGRDLTAALALAVEVESLAAQYWHVLQLGPPILLDDAEMARVIEKFRTYGGNAV